MAREFGRKMNEEKWVELSTYDAVEQCKSPMNVFSIDLFGVWGDRRIREERIPHIRFLKDLTKFYNLTNLRLTFQNFGSPEHAKAIVCDLLPSLKVLVSADFSGNQSFGASGVNQFINGAKSCKFPKSLKWICLIGCFPDGDLDKIENVPSDIECRLVFRSLLHLIEPLTGASNDSFKRLRRERHEGLLQEAPKNSESTPAIKFHDLLSNNPQSTRMSISSMHPGHVPQDPSKSKIERRVLLFGPLGRPQDALAEVVEHSICQYDNRDLPLYKQLVRSKGSIGLSRVSETADSQSVIEALSAKKRSCTLLHFDVNDPGYLPLAMIRSQLDVLFSALHDKNFVVTPGPYEIVLVAFVRGIGKSDRGAPGEFKKVKEALQTEASHLISMYNDEPKLLNIFEEIFVLDPELVTIPGEKFKLSKTEILFPEQFCEVQSLLYHTIRRIKSNYSPSEFRSQHNRSPELRKSEQLRVFVQLELDILRNEKHMPVLLWAQCVSKYREFFHSSPRTSEEEIKQELLSIRLPCSGELIFDPSGCNSFIVLSSKWLEEFLAPIYRLQKGQLKEPCRVANLAMGALEISPLSLPHDLGAREQDFWRFIVSILESHGVCARMAEAGSSERLPNNLSFLDEPIRFLSEVPWFLNNPVNPNRESEDEDGPSIERKRYGIRYNCTTRLSMWRFFPKVVRLLRERGLILKLWDCGFYVLSPDVRTECKVEFSNDYSLLHCTVIDIRSQFLICVNSTDPFSACVTAHKLSLQICHVIECALLDEGYGMAYSVEVLFHSTFDRAPACRETYPMLKLNELGLHANVVCRGGLVERVADLLGLVGVSEAIAKAQLKKKERYPKVSDIFAEPSSSSFPPISAPTSEDRNRCFPSSPPCSSSSPPCSSSSSSRDDSLLAGESPSPVRHVPPVQMIGRQLALLFCNSEEHDLRMSNYEERLTLLQEIIFQMLTCNPEFCPNCSFQLQRFSRRKEDEDEMRQ